MNDVDSDKIQQKTAERQNGTGRKPKTGGRTGAGRRWDHAVSQALVGLGAPAGVIRALRQLAGVTLMLAGASLMHSGKRSRIRADLLSEQERLVGIVRPWATSLPRLLLRDFRNGLLRAGLSAPLVADLTGTCLRTVNNAASDAGVHLLRVRHSNG